MADQKAEGKSNGEGRTEELMSECRQILYSENTEIHSMLQSVVDLIGKVDKRLTVIEKNTSSLEKLDAKMTSLANRVTSTEKEVKVMREKVQDIEKSVEAHSDYYDDVKKSVEEVGKVV
ncbi:hypothetical protein FSP39_013217 [Pinctada imbricata]|uniref:Uncharacterized protein n=1 Tax=Pinctada imbricata TaxID=66713 RepID=A0AA88YJQ8_PINIB|nr:hypothetical protein FSP39_013217 [Pinctada imbricata]